MSIYLAIMVMSLACLVCGMLTVVNRKPSFTLMGNASKVIDRRNSPAISEECLRDDVEELCEDPIWVT